MLDFTPVKRDERTMNELVTGLTVEDLARLTEESVGRLEALLEGLTDADVTFVPNDPSADDAAATDPADRALAWTLGHVIAHTTASGEEYAAVATEFARGVPFHGRPRYETPWWEVMTLAQCRQRLDESRRIRLASLGMWPDTPHLEVGHVYWDTSGWVNAKGIFAWGLAHDNDHRRHLEEIACQAAAARGVTRLVESGQSHDGSHSDGGSVSDLNAQASPNRVVAGKGDADDLSVKNP